jgi:hypothetical protein
VARADTMSCNLAMRADFGLGMTKAGVSDEEGGAAIGRMIPSFPEKIC